MGRTGTGTQVQKMTLPPPPFFSSGLSGSCGPEQSRESLRELLSLAHLSLVLIIRVLSLLSVLGCALRSPSSVPRCPLFPGVVRSTRAPASSTHSDSGLGRAVLTRLVSSTYLLPVELTAVFVS